MVVRKENESFDSLISRFKKEVINSGVLLEYRSRLEYTPPSLKRRMKSEKARKKAEKNKR